MSGFSWEKCRPRKVMVFGMEQLKQLFNMKGVMKT